VIIERSSITRNSLFSFTVYTVCLFLHALSTMVGQGPSSRDAAYVKEEEPS